VYLSWVRGGGGGEFAKDLKMARCEHCLDYSIWKSDTMIYPYLSVAPQPNPDMPEDVVKDYREAASILALSPRGSAAILRLAIQKLCIHLGQPGKDLNSDIGKLVERGLKIDVQKALDTVRVIGNNSVHPGQIDVRDDPAIAESLFQLVNFIVDSMISQPKRIAEVYNKLPPTAKAQISDRDSK